MSKVSLKKTPDYSKETLARAVEAHFSSLEVEKDIKPGMKVLIKPNLLAARKPDDAATTHPALVLAVTEWLNAHGISDITVADSPGGPYVQTALKTIYSVCGYRLLSEKAKISLTTGWKEVKTRPGMNNRSFNLIDPVIEADYIINMPKLKTHGMTVISAGVKNLFGTIPGLQKPEMHYRYPEIHAFSDMLTELAETVAPNITLIDAVEAMEGNGPNAGTKKAMGLTLASRDIFAQDYVAARLMGFVPQDVELCASALKKGLFDPEKIELTGDEFAPDPFIPPETARTDFLTGIPAPFHKPLLAAANLLLRPMPRLDKAKCVGCGKCAESCPPKIIVIKKRRAHFTRRGCISCFCCQEMCPAKAINVRRSLGGRL